MLSPSLVTFFAVAVFCIVEGYDITRQNVEVIDFREEDVVSPDELTENERATAKQQNYRFIGDLVLGQRRADEMVFRRRVEISNPSEEVYSNAVVLTVERGQIHFLSILNEQGSYAVACDEPFSLGSSRSSFNVRVPPQTQSVLSLLVAAH